MQTLRSDILIHWAGKCIQKDYRVINEIQSYQDQYIDLLKKILKEGLWMTVNEEKICGPGNAEIRYNEDLYPNYPMISFTEIKPSDIEKHTRSYGCLGFGFCRDFVIKLHGAPVQYVTSNEYDDITAHFDRQLKELEALAKALKNLKDCGDPDALKWYKHLLEKAKECLNPYRDNNKSVEDIICHLQKCLNDCDDIFSGLLHSVSNNVLYTKKMWKNNPNPNDFLNLDEFEWRIVFAKEYCIDGKKKIIFRNNDKPIFKFDQNDLKLLVLPGEGTQEKALPYINKWFQNVSKKPKIATIEECLQKNFSVCD